MKQRKRFAARLLAPASGRSVRHITLQGGKHKKECHIERCQRQQITDPEHIRNTVELKIISFFCGQISVAAFSHTVKPDFDVNAVDRDVQDMARAATGSSDECDFFLKWLWERSLNIFEKEGMWFTIGTLANELIESRTIEGERLKILYNQAMGRQTR